MIVWIKKQLNYYYKDNLKEKTIEELESEIKQQHIINKKITSDLEKIASINHTYTSRISALESWAKNIDNEEFSSELSIVKNTINDLSTEYYDELSKSSTSCPELPQTNLPPIDNMIKYMHKLLIKDNINFDLILNTNCLNLKEIIPQNKLETLLVDLIKNAHISIKSSNKKYNSILIKISLINNIYEINISDTGIPFELNTLLTLGTLPTTTHKDIGGSGIGYITIFDILNYCSASLIIKEYPIENTYSKTITIRFDGKRKYIIKSYRFEELLSKNINSKIIIEQN